MSKPQVRLKISAGKSTPVPTEQLARFKEAMAERVVKPVQERAAAQRDQAAKVRSRHVR
jgi:hypothetical protein